MTQPGQSVPDTKAAQQCLPVLAEPIAEAAVEAVGQTGRLLLQAVSQLQQIRLRDAPGSGLDSAPVQHNPVGSWQITQGP